jgi:hypothetical protein
MMLSHISPGDGEMWDGLCLWLSGAGSLARIVSIVYGPTKVLP